MTFLRRKELLMMSTNDDKKIRTDLVKAMYYKSNGEKFRFPLFQKGFWGYVIAHHARGGHSHEELLFKEEVLSRFKMDVESGEFWNIKTLHLSDKVCKNILTAFPICISSSERDGGVRAKKAYEVYKNPENWDVVSIPCTMEQAVEMLTFCIQRIGLKYDWAGVIGFKLSFINENKKKWYCSELCDAAKKAAGLWPSFYRSHPSDSYWIQRFILDAYLRQEAQKIGEQDEKERE
jgi:hypothetical protein